MNYTKASHNRWRWSRAVADGPRTARNWVLGHMEDHGEVPYRGLTTRAGWPDLVHHTDDARAPDELTPDT